MHVTLLLLLPADYNVLLGMISGDVGEEIKGKLRLVSSTILLALRQEKGAPAVPTPSGGREEMEPPRKRIKEEGGARRRVEEEQGSRRSFDSRRREVNSRSPSPPFSRVRGASTSRVERDREASSRPRDQSGSSRSPRRYPGPSRSPGGYPGPSRSPGGYLGPECLPRMTTEAGEDTVPRGPEDGVPAGEAGTSLAKDRSKRRHQN